VEEQVVGGLGVRSEELAAQLGRQGEGHQEIRHGDELLQFARDPAGGGLPPALRTGLVIAGVPGEVNVPATWAGKSLAAQRRGAAMGEGPEGATLHG